MNYYLAKIKIKPDEGKPYKMQIIVNDSGITEAEVKVNKFFEGDVSEFEVEEIKKTKIDDVILN